MNKEDIIAFIDQNSDERIWEMYKMLYEKQSALNKRIDRIIVYIILLVLVYFISSKTSISSLQIGPMSIADLSIVEKLTPGIFAYLILDHALTSAHRIDNEKLLELLTKKIFINTIEDKLLKKAVQRNYFRILLPLSFGTELADLNNKKRFKVLEGILIVPLLFIMVLPFIFEVLIIKNAILYHWNGWIVKVSVFFSIWVFFAFVLLNFKRQFYK